MYCVKCGAKINDEAMFCSECGAPTTNNQPKAEPVTTAPTAKKDDTLQIVAKVFMIISCVVTGFYLIPLAWTIPMTIHYCNKIKNNEPVGTGFKICTLLFVNTVAGILMLCDKD